MFSRAEVHHDFTTLCISPARGSHPRRRRSETMVLCGEAPGPMDWGSVLNGNGAHELLGRMAMAKAMAKVSGIERQRHGM